MKFLVLALCVCAANAASLGLFAKRPFEQNYQQRFQQPAVQVVAKAVSLPAGVVLEPFKTTKTIAEAPVVAGKSVYTAVNDAEAKIVRSDSDVSSNGYNYYFEADNGIAAQASGVAKKVGNEDTIVVQGSYKYIDSNGKEVVVTYVADENGFQPQSDILPVGPATPEYILRSLEYISAHPNSEYNKQANY